MTTATIAPRPALRDANDPCTPNLALAVRNLANARLWEASDDADHIRRGLAKLAAGELTIEGGNWLLRHLRPLTPCQPRNVAGPRPRPSNVHIPDGYYMINGRRFRVTTPKEGRYAGKISLREQLPNDASAWPKGADRAAIIAWIASDWQAAAAEYGKHTGRCGMCHRLLTDETSVASGAGPDCRDKYGIPTIQPTA